MPANLIDRAIPALRNWVAPRKARALSALKNLRQRKSWSIAHEDVPAEAVATTGVCLGFFGITRNLSKTVPSIKKNVIDVLQTKGRVTSVAHFNRPLRVNSLRSGEYNVIFENPDLRQLNCEMVWLEPQLVARIQELADFTLQYPFRDESDPSGEMRKNALLQLYSQSRLLELLSFAGLDRFDVFCLTRADLLFLDSIPLDAIEAVRAGQVDMITPSWHRWGGFNDRFALCSRKGAEVYLRRIERVEEFCRDKGYFHPEELLQFCAENAELRWRFFDVRAKRVRATGAVRNEDFSEGLA